MSTLRTPPQGGSIPASTSAAQGETAGDQPLPPELVDIVVAELRYQTAFHLEAVQAMMDGVTLGAEQVQDKRIEYLEVGPSTDPEAAIMLFALTLVLEGTIGPAVAALATRAVMRPMMRATAKAINLQSRRDMGEMTTDIRLFRTWARSFQSAASSGRFSLDQSQDLLKMARNAENAAAKLRNDLRGKLGEAKPVRDALNQVTIFTQNNLVAATKAGIAVGSAPGSPQALSPDDTPGVEVRAAAMASASKLRLTVVAAHEALEAELRRPGMKVSEARQILDDYRVDDALSLAYIRGSFQYATEAMIWSNLIIDQETIQEARGRAQRAATQPFGGAPDAGTPLVQTRPVREVYEPYLSKLKAHEKLVDYLLGRFDDELERWTLENDIQIPILEARGSAAAFGTPRLTGWWKQLTKQQRIDLLIQYLVDIYERTPPELKLR
jgi:hypothetical protein